jgi:hypothetical protein
MNGFRASCLQPLGACQKRGFGMLAKAALPWAEVEA